MSKKRVFHTETAYVLGIIIMAMGCAFMTKADFGLSMVVAPAYLLSLKLSEFSSFFTFGVCEYLFQGFLLVLMMAVLRRFKLSYFFSFVTAVIYGYTLNLFLFLINLIPDGILPLRIVFYLLGMVSCSIAVALMIHTYIAPEVYELIVKEVPTKFGWNLTVFKTVYDITSMVIAVIMSFCFFGMWHFEGVKWGTLICALVNGFLIGRISTFMDKKFEFKDAFKLRRIFQK